MSRAEAFPLYSPGDLRRAFTSDAVTRRVAKICDWTKGSKILDLGCGPTPAAIVLARELGCQVVAVDSSEAIVDAAREKVRAAGAQDRVDVKKVAFDQLPFAESDFEGILIQGRVLYPVEEAVRQLRRLLARNGKLALTYPVKVGRFPAKPSLEVWEERLGEPLRLPRELLQLLERNGYEPQAVETATDSELDEAYRAIEPELKNAPAEKLEAVRQEIELHRAQGGKASVSFALAIGRRREPGEKPPPTRDRG